MNTALKMMLFYVGALSSIARADVLSFSPTGSGSAPTMNWSCTGSQVSTTSSDFLCVFPTSSSSPVDKYNFGGHKFSIEAWVKPDTVANGVGYAILSKGEECSTTLTPSSTRGEDLNFFLVGRTHSSVLKLQIGVALAVPGYTDQVVYYVNSTSVDISRTDWSHVAVTYDNTVSPPDVTFYVNGTSYGAVRDTGAAPDPSANATPVASDRRVWIGLSPWTGTAYTSAAQDPFSGRLAEIRVWDDVRTSGQLAACYARIPPDLADSDLLAYFRLDGAIEISGSTYAIDGGAIPRGNAALGGGGSANRCFPTFVSDASLPVIRARTALSTSQACAGVNTYTLSCAVDAGGTWQYQWGRDNAGTWAAVADNANPALGPVISGSNTSSMTIEFGNLGQDRRYACRVSSGCGTYFYTFYESLLPCVGDFNHDEVVDFFDYLDYVAAFSSGNASADVNCDTSIDFFDYLDFVAAFSNGC